MTLPQSQTTSFQKEILEWYSHHQRDLPWRRDRDPYHILVSEIMLQQTQVSRVIPKYEAWLKVFPNLETLAQASTRDVLLHWSGLGYNRRALYLHKLAKELVGDSQFIIHSKTQTSSPPSPKRRRSKGDLLVKDESQNEVVWPQTEKELRKLAGIGEYTARALLCFAFNKQIAIVDTNVRKVIFTKFQIPSNKSQINSKNKNSKKIISGSTSPTISMTHKEIQAIADQLLPKGKAYEWNQALMDFASAMLKEHKIPIPKQSQFRDSDRYFRGQILKRLLEAQQQTEKDLLAFFEAKKTPIEHARLKAVLETLKKDKFIIVKNRQIILS